MKSLDSGRARRPAGARAPFPEGKSAHQHARVLLVDDDLELTRMLSAYLEADPLELNVVCEGESALEWLGGAHCDLIVLDIMLPGIDGYQVLRQVRQQSLQVPVLMLSARGGDDDRIMGLEAGADDYLPKPFNPRELRARMLALLRRGLQAGRSDVRRSPQAEGLLSLGVLQLHVASGLASIDGQQARLTNAETRILEVLMRAAGQPVRRAVLTHLVLGRSLLPSDRSMDTHTSNLRRKLGLHGGAPGRPLLRSLRNVGYVLQLADDVMPEALR